MGCGEGDQILDPQQPGKSKKVPCHCQCQRWSIRLVNKRPGLGQNAKLAERLRELKVAEFGVVNARTNIPSHVTIKRTKQKPSGGW